jgi:hypothetical protein
MVVGFLLILSSLAPPAYAAKDDLPTVKDIYVGDRFKYPILKVRPTQGAVGMRAVDVKLKDMKDMSKDELKQALKKDPIPVVAAPDGNFYMIDHHHQALAAYEAGRENAYYVLHTDYSKLKDMDEFWSRMKLKHWVREFDHLGRPIKIPGGLPRTILGMLDDPYRSLAWFVRKLGGYKKTAVEFAEFVWADYFRSPAEPGGTEPRIDLGTTDKDFKKATEKANVMAHSADANGLPGYSPSAEVCRSLLEGATP